MRAGRLLAFAAVLFIMASLAAAIAPSPQRRHPARADRPPAASSTAATTLTERLPGPGGKPLTVRAEVGDLVDLTVMSPGLDTAVISDTASGGANVDRSEPVDPHSPAHFQFIADAPGHFDVRLEQSEALVGRLVVGGG